MGALSIKTVQRELPPRYIDAYLTVGTVHLNSKYPVFELEFQMIFCRNNRIQTAHGGESCVGWAWVPK